MQNSNGGRERGAGNEAGSRDDRLNSPTPRSGNKFTPTSRTSPPNSAIRHRLASSVTRAYNIYLKSGWPLARFIDALYQARAKTRERSGGIRTELPKDDPWGTKPKMAYFFSVLEDEVGLRDEEAVMTATR